MSNRIQRVKGINDVLPTDYSLKNKVQTQLLNHFRLFGYAPLATPILEHSELYLRKSGEDIVSRMYDFNYRNRRLCLRPEMTASVIRAYIDNFQDDPLPVRLAYAGPVFRYEKPQRARYRQFTQIGLELIGASSPQADAEAIHIACSGLNTVGLNNYRLLIGHVGILPHYLQSIGIEGQLRNFLTINMEILKKQELSQLVERINQVFPSIQITPNTPPDPETHDTAKERSQKLIEILKDMDEDQARQAVLDFLQTLNISIDSNRDENEIIDRLLHKIKRDDQAPKLHKALNFMQELNALSGKAADTLPEAQKLLATYHVGETVVAHLQTLTNLLRDYGLPLDQVTLDLGLNRGLQYYTGMVFEIHHQALGEERQLCGGGRYDELITILGGTKTPATGFSYGLERICIALDSEQDKTTSSDYLPQVLVINTESDDLPFAITISQLLRQNSIPTELAVRERTLKSNLQYAAKRSIPHVIIVGKRERDNNSVTLRNMSQHEEQLIATDQLVSTLQETQLVR